MDLEQVNNYNLDVFSKREKRYVSDNFNKIRIFTLKEAYGKYFGIGLNYNYKDIDLYSSNMNFSRYNLYFKTVVYDKMVLSSCSCYENMLIEKVDVEKIQGFIDKHIIE